MENKEPIKNPLDFVLDNTDEKPTADAMDDYFHKTEEALGQFMFLLFIPNSHTRTVEVYIDKGEYHTWYTIDEFGEKIKTICGVTEANRLMNACRELGVPFLYDRVKGTLVEIKEKPQKQRLSVNTIKDLGGFGHVEAPAYGTNSVFESVKGQYLDLVNNLMKGEMNGNT
jgi:hypothetical protein